MRRCVGINVIADNLINIVRAFTATAESPAASQSRRSHFLSYSYLSIRNPFKAGALKAAHAQQAPAKLEEMSIPGSFSFSGLFRTPQAG